MNLRNATTPVYLHAFTTRTPPPNIRPGGAPLPPRGPRQWRGREAARATGLLPCRSYKPAWRPEEPGDRQERAGEDTKTDQHCFADGTGFTGRPRIVAKEGHEVSVIARCMAGWARASISWWASSAGP